MVFRRHSGSQRDCGLEAVAFRAVALRAEKAELRAVAESFLGGGSHRRSLFHDQIVPKSRTFFLRCVATEQGYNKSSFRYRTTARMHQEVQECKPDPLFATVSHFSESHFSI